MAAPLSIPHQFWIKPGQRKAVSAGLENIPTYYLKTGSFYFIAELIVDLDLEYDTAVTDHCGSCTACIDACPTNAIVEPYKVDGSKCISYFTIELKDEIPYSMAGQFDDWMFGCDVCQDVCPWNRFSKAHREPLFDPHPAILEYDKKKTGKRSLARHLMRFSGSRLSKEPNLKV